MDTRWKSVALFIILTSIRQRQGTCQETQSPTTEQSATSEIAVTSLASTSHSPGYTDIYSTDLPSTSLKSTTPSAATFTESTYTAEFSTTSVEPNPGSQSTTTLDDSTSSSIGSSTVSTAISTLPPTCKPVVTTPKDHTGIGSLSLPALVTIPVAVACVLFMGIAITFVCIKRNRFVSSLTGAEEPHHKDDPIGATEMREDGVQSPVYYVLEHATELNGNVHRNSDMMQYLKDSSSKIEENVEMIENDLYETSANDWKADIKDLGSDPTVRESMADSDPVSGTCYMVDNDLYCSSDF